MEPIHWMIFLAATAVTGIGAVLDYLDPPNRHDNATAHNQT